MHEHETPLPSRQHRYPGLPRLSEARVHARREAVFLIFAGLFLGTLAMLNILGISRFIRLGSIGGYELLVAVGVLPYPITFLCTDFISELYGRARANLVVWVGLILNVWVVSMLWLGGVLPGVEPLDEAGRIATDAAGRAPAFFEIRALAFGAVTASMLAYLFAQFVDVHLFHLLKRATKNKAMWLRNNGSTLLSQLVDTTAVILITHYGAKALPVVAGEPLLPQFMVFIATGYVYKMVAALLDTVPFVLLAPRLARYLRLPPPTELPDPPAAAAVEAGVG